MTIDDGCVLMMSTVGNGCFLPFRAALYLTAVMENTIIAQNTCLQMCVIGRNSFVGAGNTFTDFNLIEQKPDPRGRASTVSLRTWGRSCSAARSGITAASVRGW